RSAPGAALPHPASAPVRRRMRAWASATRGSASAIDCAAEARCVPGRSVPWMVRAAPWRPSSRATVRAVRRRSSWATDDARCDAIVARCAATAAGSATNGSAERAAAELVVTLAEERVRYTEIRWAPRLHLERGLGVGSVIEAVAQGIEDAIERLGSSAPAVSLIVTAMRSHPPAANVLLAREAAAFGEPVAGFDLAGLEAEWPAPPHAAAFAAAAEGGLKLTAH